MLRKLLPKKIKIQLHLLKNELSDFKNGYTFKFAKPDINIKFYDHSISIKQQLKPNDSKKHNLSLAIEKIESVEIKPNQIFSFWKIVGNPSKKNGFVESRSIVDGEIKSTIGGGLCQLSGLIYYISLYANLKILERHNHSLDIYTSETRFTPLGSDATVAFAYKDLKIKNTLSKPINFQFQIEEEYLTIVLNHSDQIEKMDIVFKEKELENNLIEVFTWLNGKINTKSIYKRHDL
ncbi:VanW family protein [Aureivirga sp. CE67]|uniref:VanW family protein n=1 Tax=Aureivirga sp. CE67 TaxID=1788983 RepID=UPI0018CA79E9|nr:VanW family protein [Aureivirga sp. CE67]